MRRIIGTPRDYSWGSHSALRRFCERPAPDGPLAEIWYGAHPAAPALVANAGSLLSMIDGDPESYLGADVGHRYAQRLPFLLKLIAPAEPLSLQVHPTLRMAQRRYADESTAGVPLNAPERNYKDANHKPELVYALSKFEAMCGFRAPRRAAELLRGLGTPATDALYEHLRSSPNSAGVEAAFTALFRSPPSARELAQVAGACQQRLAGDSPSPRADRMVVLLHSKHPGDPGVVAPLLLNPVSLRPGEAVFVPAGGVHAYFSGIAVELMAASDNVLRAGLTRKHVDVEEMLANVDYVAAPPVRIAPEVTDDELTEVFYVPVDDFQLAVAHLIDVPRMLDGWGPRIVLCVAGEARISTGGECESLRPGQAVFIAAHEDEPEISGTGRLVQASVP